MVRPGARRPVELVGAGLADGLQPGRRADLSRGLLRLLPNPRGSFGQGEAFTRANVKDFGRGDLRDILAGRRRGREDRAGRRRSAWASPAGATAAS